MAKRNSGERYELHCMRKMRLHGYIFVHQCGRTNRADFGGDIVARGFLFRKIVVQCKDYNKPVGVSAVQQAYAAKRYYGASRAAVAARGTFTKAARQLAKACGVSLWARY